MNQLSSFSSRDAGHCLIVEDHPTTSDFLRRSISDAFPEIEPVSIRDLREARSWLKRYEEQTEREDGPLRLALIDLGLPDGNGIEIVRYLAEKNPHVPSIVITIYDDDANLFGALSAGASGYILKDDDQDALTALLRRIAQGEPPLSPSIAHRLITHFRAPVSSAKNTVALTSREQETLTLIARGFTVAEAAGKMGLSPQTVAGYVKIIYQKLHISSRAEATREAIRRGLA